MPSKPKIESLPARHLLQQQAAWLASARTKLLRRVSIARRKCVLDLGCGAGAVTEELRRRSGGTVVALDCQRNAFAHGTPPSPCALGVCGHGHCLPFREGVFDLVFSQFSLLWMDAAGAVSEIARVLQPGGACVALEPDFDGLIEHPPEIALRPIWREALNRAGADPDVGRKLPGLFARAGFTVQVDFLDRLFPPSALRYEFLTELPLTAEERQAVRRVQTAEKDLPAGQTVVFLPLFLLTAAR